MVISSHTVISFKSAVPLYYVDGQQLNQNLCKTIETPQGSHSFHSFHPLPWSARSPRSYLRHRLLGGLLWRRVDLRTSARMRRHVTTITRVSDKTEVRPVTRVWPPQPMRNRINQLCVLKNFTTASAFMSRHFMPVVGKIFDSTTNRWEIIRKTVKGIVVQTP